MYAPIFYAAAKVSVVGVEKLPSDTAGISRDETGLSDGWVWKLTEGPVTIYEDAGLTRPVYTTPQLHDFFTPDAQANGTPEANTASAVRNWRLPTLIGLPVAGAGDRSPDTRKLLLLQDMASNHPTESVLCMDLGNPRARP